ncbi:low-density lipoprotein receptor-like [Saccoglossus kowalevskii]
MDTILRCTVTIILAASVYFPGVYQTYTGRSIMWTDVKYGRFQTTSRLLSLNGTGKDAINGSASVQVLQSAYFEIKTALTFDFDDSLVFWGEIVGGAIYKMDLLTNDIRSIYSNNHSSVTSLSADWLAKKLYWTDSFFNWIKVSDYNGTYHRTLVHTGKQFVGGIVVNPLSGYMYWSEREQEPRIEMATLTGENRRSLVYNISYFQRPQGLTIDFNENRLFWVDIELSLLSSISLSDSSANPLYHSVGEYLAYYLDVDSGVIKYYSNVTSGFTGLIDVDPS